MVKILINEQQAQYLLEQVEKEKNITLIEEQILNEQKKLYTIRDLAEIVASVNGQNDKELIEFLVKEFVRAYKHSKDEGVMELFKYALVDSGIRIKAISHGKYELY